MDSNPAEQTDHVSWIGGLVRGLTTNVAELNDRDADDRLRLWHSPHAPDEVVRHLTSWVRTKRRWSFADEPPSVDATKIQLKHRSALFRFVDDVEMRLVACDNGTTIHARSESRIGKGDLGQNRRNLVSLRRGVPDVTS